MPRAAVEQLRVIHDFEPGTAGLQACLYVVLLEGRTQVGPFHGVGSDHFPGVTRKSVIGGQGGTQGAAGVARGGLDPQVVELPVPEHPAVADAIESDAAAQAEVSDAVISGNGARKAHHDLFGHGLYRRSQVHVPLRQRLLGLARGTAEQVVEPPVRHRQSGAVVEVIEVQPERAVRFQVDQMVMNESGVLRLAVRRESHELVFARIDLESRVVRKRRIKQAERVRKVDFPLDDQLAAVPDGNGCRGPLPDAVHREHHGPVERRRIEGAGGVTQMMFGKQQPPVPPEFGRKTLQLPLEQIL